MSDKIKIGKLKFPLKMLAPHDDATIVVADANGKELWWDDEIYKIVVVANQLHYENKELRQEVERLRVVLEPICDGYMHMQEMINGRDEEGGVPIPQIIAEAYSWLQRKEAGK